MSDLTGRSGLARVLMVSEKTARALQRRGEIAPEAVIDGREYFSVSKAQALRDKRAQRRGHPKAA